MAADTLPGEWPVTRFIEQLRRHRDALARRYHIESLGIFGSYARNEQREGSDLDLLFIRTWCYVPFGSATMRSRS